MCLRAFGVVKMFYKTYAARRPILAKIMVKKHAISRKYQLYALPFLVQF